MASGLRRFIRDLHREFDSWIGRAFSKQPSLSSLAGEPHNKIGIDDFKQFAYSKREHFKRFHILPVHQNQTPATCDLKVYQDSLIYSLIVDNFKPGCRMLEIGGGESRVISALKNDYEVWNLDKLEGLGFGPKGLMESTGFKIIKEYIGAFSSELPDAHFDLVFSISTVEHFSSDEIVVEAILADIQRVLKPGGYSVHCVDALLYSDHLFVHPLVSTVLSRIKGAQVEADFKVIASDEDLWLMPWFAYYTRWYHLTRQSLKKFGQPFSINVLWRKEQ